MDTQSVILLSVINLIISGLISGVVIYILQKRIDSTFQKSLIDYKIRSPKLHEKRVETLETVYKKYRSFNNNVLQELGRIALISLGVGNALQNVENLEITLFKEINEFQNYLNEVRLFLPHDVIEKITNISRDSNNLLVILYVALGLYAASPPQKDFEPLYSLILAGSFKTNAITKTKLDLKLLVDDAKEEFGFQLLKIENLYKAETEPKS